MIKDLHEQAKKLYEKACEPNPNIDPDDLTGFLGQLLDEFDQIEKNNLKIKAVLKQELINSTNWDDRYSYNVPLNVDELLKKLEL